MSRYELLFSRSFTERFVGKVLTVFPGAYTTDWEKDKHGALQLSLHPNLAGKEKLGEDQLSFFTSSDTIYLMKQHTPVFQAYAYI